MNESGDDIIPEAEDPSPDPEPPPLPPLWKTRRTLIIVAGIIVLWLLAYWRFTALKSLLSAVLPYALYVVPILIALAAIIFKDWDKYGPKWVRWMVLALLLAALVGNVVHQVSQRHEKAAAAALNQANIDGLKGQVAAAQQAQEDNTKQFLVSLDALSEKVSALETQVNTKELRAELATVKGELQRTQAALAPSPKAKLTFSFAPVLNVPLGQGIEPVTEVRLPVEPDGSVKVQFSVLNLTDVAAVDGTLTLQICDQCKFAKEPAGFTKLAGQDDRKRNMDFSRLLPHVISTTMTADVIAPAHAESFHVKITPRCVTCVVDRRGSGGIVRIRRGR